MNEEHEPTNSDPTEDTAKTEDEASRWTGYTTHKMVVVGEIGDVASLRVAETTQMTTITWSDNRHHIIPALVRALSEVSNIAKDSNAETQQGRHYRYASLGQVLDLGRTALGVEDLIVMQSPIADRGQVSVETIILHASGEWCSQLLTLGVGAEGWYSPQAIGSAITYARRYSLMALLGMATEDDDGAAAVQAFRPVAEEPVSTDPFDNPDRSRLLATREQFNTITELTRLLTPEMRTELKSWREAEQLPAIKIDELTYDAAEQILAELERRLNRQLPEVVEEAADEEDDVTDESPETAPLDSEEETVLTEALHLADSTEADDDES